MVADGILFFAGWSPGGPDDKEFQMPTFDEHAQGARHGQGRQRCRRRRGREGASTDFFDNQDANKDGKVTRDEWDAILKFMSEGEEQRLRPEARRAPAT